MVAAALTLGCPSRTDAPAPVPSSSATVASGAATAESPAPAAASSASPLPPLEAESWLVTLPAPPEAPALVSVPLGAREPRPIVVGVHGAGDRPEWACGGYRGALDAFPFVVCPAGVPCGGGKLCTAAPAELARRIDAAISALRERFGAHVAPGPLVLVGFSLGAIHGAELLWTRGAEFPRALLLEGGERELTPALARGFVAEGGERVLLLCAADDCAGRFGPAASALERAGAQVRVVAAGTHRHNLDGAMVAAVSRAWPWLVEGLPGWRGYLDRTRRARAPAK